MAIFPSSSYALGILFLVIVSILWTVCSMVVQHLYNDMQFDSPFLIVYIGTSLFSVFLPMRLGYERWGHCFTESCRVYGECCGCCDGTSDKEVKEIVIIPWRNSNVTTTSSACEDGDDVEGLVPSENNSLHNQNAHCNNVHESNSDDKSDVEMHSFPKYQQQSTPNDHDDDYSFSNENCVQNYEPTHPSRSNSSSSTDSNSNNNTTSCYLLSHQDHISMASKVAPLWFLSNYFYAMSLKWTTISSSTVLASMGSIFAFGFATCSRFGDEKVTKGKLMGVALCFLGGVATTWTDVGSDNGSGADGNDGGAEDLRHLRYLRHSASSHLPHISDLANDSSILTLLGDLAGFFSAIGYGGYTVMIRHLCPKDEDRMSMQLLFGYIGLWNMVLLLPMAIWVALSPNDDNDGSQNIHPESASEWESPSSDDTITIHTTLTWSIFLFLLLKGLLDNVVSDYLWARAVILTSATVASVGVGLTIPMAFVADWVMGNYNGTQAGDVWAAILVLLGFVFVNMNVFGEKGDDGEELEVNFEEDGRMMDAHSAHDVEILS